MVAALAHADADLRIRLAQCGSGLHHPAGRRLAAAILGEITQAGGSELKVYADVFVSFSANHRPAVGRAGLRRHARRTGRPAAAVAAATASTVSGCGRPSTPPTCPSSSTRWCRCCSGRVDSAPPTRRRDAARTARLARRREPLCQGGTVMTVPLSILDLAPISEGCDAATALRNTVDLAQHAEQWGYKRYWIAEHHFVAVAQLVARSSDRPDRRRHRTRSASARPRCNSARPPPSRSSRASACSTRSTPAASISASGGPVSGAARR